MKNIVKPTYEFISSQTTKLQVNKCILDSFLSREPRAPAQSSMPATHN